MSRRRPVGRPEGAVGYACLAFGGGPGEGELRTAGREVDANVLARISPARSSAVNYYGSITVDYERELAQLDDEGHRPLRTVAVDEPGAGL
ncbi:hypothetical protein [Streptomyces sp. NPDC003015]